MTVARVLLGALMVAAAGAVVVAVRSGDGERERGTIATTPTAAQARRALTRGNYAAAEGIAKRILAAPGRPTPEVLLIAGEAATKQRRFDDALGYYDRVPEGVEEEVTALLAAGEILLLERRRMREAEAKYRAALRLSPDHPLANNRLALLLSVSGRRWESVTFLLNLIRLRQAGVQNLCLLGQIEGVFLLPEEFRPADAEASDDPLPLLGLARGELDANEPQKATKLLRRALELDPSLTEARVQLGRALAMAGDPVAFDRWRSEATAAMLAHPETWLTLGQEALRRGRREEAVRSFWEAVRLGPEYQPANYQLGLLLRSLGRPDHAAPFLGRAGLQQELAAAVGVLKNAPTRVADMRKAAEATEKLGRYWESRGWCEAALVLNSNEQWARRLGEGLAARLAKEFPQTDPAKLPAIDLSEYPLPETGTASPETEPTLAAGRIAFTEDATRLGIAVAYFKGTPPEQPSKRMHEFTGGGVGAFDFDGDGRPDLFLTQGCTFPPTGEAGPTDRLFRNLGDRFADVTDSSRAAEAVPGFGQGVACGDFDGDGLSDVYVGNVGRNRLLRNNGDGTFTDATDEAGLPDVPLTQAWTTSVLIADVSGDGLPDLFDANYLSGPGVYELVCPDSRGKERACSPNVFPACPDRLLVNAGDGAFADATVEAGVTAPNGNGLGLVAADFDGSGRLGVLVANDQTPNHLYANLTEPRGPVRLEERALATGVAVDRDGRPQANMGVAVDDADADGRFDLYVTTFYLESKTLFRQLPGGEFEDATVAFGLRDPGYRTLGFGTQFLDADLDGRPDLVVTNGHVDDYSDRGIPFRMRPQLYRNLGGRFEELPADMLGLYFAGEYLGRGLATLDANGDGREDFAVSHLDSPAAVLTNRSSAGRSLGVRLVATTTARDAIGVTVTVDSANGTRVRQLTAGDGYQASNERRLTFGLGAAEAGDVKVRWPSGRTESFPNLAAGVDWLFVEGRDRPIPLAPHRPRSDGAGLRTASDELPARPR